MGLFGRNRQAEQAPRSSGQLALHPKADRHTSSLDDRKKLSQSMTEPLYEVRDPQSGRRYAPAPAPSYYGPHFEKGPSQEEIWNTRQRKEVWHSQKRVDEVEFQDEYCRRAHTFHQPVHQHQYSTPYEVRPIPWTNQMSAEYNDYKRLEKKNEINRPPVKEAKDTTVGRKQLPTIAHGEIIESGISYAIAGRIGANQASQARAGFDHKYPQAYTERGIRTHREEAKNLKKSAANYRNAETQLVALHGRWQVRMSSQSQYSIK